MKQKIVSRWDSSEILFECRADLTGADLRGAKLNGINDACGLLDEIAAINPSKQE